MSDPREHLQSMLSHLIKGNDQDASEAVHNYIVHKSREIALNQSSTQESDNGDDE